MARAILEDADSPLQVARTRRRVQPPGASPMAPASAMDVPVYDGAPPPPQMPRVRTGRSALPRWNPNNPVSPTNGGNTGVAGPSPEAFNIQDFIRGWLDPSRGYRNVTDFGDYISSGYGDYVYAGGSKGDKLFRKGTDEFLGDFVLAAGDAGGRGAQYLSPQSMAGGGGTVFDDPATSEWEKLLRQLVERLNQPQPTMSDSQRDLLQTQSLDPLERQRQAQRQQTTERLAARGITGGSGVLEQALQDVDRQFNQLRTGTQAGFAIDQVNREDQRFQGNEQRATNALNLFQRIPELADRRLAAAQGSLQQTNPLAYLQLLQQSNQWNQGQSNYNQQQQQQFWNDLARLFAGLF